MGNKKSVSESDARRAARRAGLKTKKSNWHRIICPQATARGPCLTLKLVKACGQ